MPRHTGGMSDILSRLRADLANARRGEIEALADLIGVKRGTLRNIVSGRTPNPRYDNVQAVARYYEIQDAAQAIGRGKRRKDQAPA